MEVKPMINNIVFALSGLAGSGKDTISAMIKQIVETKYENKVFSLAFADYLKVLCIRNFGYDDSQKKEMRNILQNFGNEIRLIEEDFFVHQVYRTIDLLRNKYDVFVITDVRYKNEFRPFPYTLSYPIINVYVDRDVNKVKDRITDEHLMHDSEDMARNPNYDNFHFVINNNGSLTSTYQQVEDMIDTVLKLAEKLLDEQRGLEEEYKNITDEEVLTKLQELDSDLQNEENSTTE